MSNVLFERNKAEEAVKARAEEIYTIAQTVNHTEHKGEAIPHLSTVYGITYNLTYWKEEELCHKWDEVEERWISKFTDRASLSVVTGTDPWDDFDSSECYDVQLPFDLAVSGTKEEIMEFFKGKFADEMARRKCVEDRELYFSLKNMDKEVAFKILSNLEDDMTYAQFEELIYACGVKKYIPISIGE